MIFEEEYFSRYSLLTYHIPLPDYLFFVGYWVIRALQLFIVQSVTSQFLKLVTVFLSSRFST